MENEKVKKITIEFETYSISLSGKHAMRWKAYVNNMFIILCMNGISPFLDKKYKWEKSFKLK